MSKRVEVWTCRVQDHRKLKEKGIDWLDATFKSGNPIFAPTRDLVMGYKRGEITEGRYKVEYRRQMEESARRHFNAWLDVLDADRIVIGCYCRRGDFCHRHLLAKLFLAFANKQTDHEVSIKGEINLEDY